jgi:hypothetical protein
VHPHATQRLPGLDLVLPHQALQKPRAVLLFFRLEGLCPCLTPFIFVPGAGRLPLARPTTEPPARPPSPAEAGRAAAKVGRSSQIRPAVKERRRFRISPRAESSSLSRLFSLMISFGGHTPGTSSSCRPPCSLPPPMQCRRRPCGPDGPEKSSTGPTLWPGGASQDVVRRFLRRPLSHGTAAGSKRVHRRIH